MHNFKKNYCFFLYIIRAVIITTEAYENAKVDTIKVNNNKLFWVKMIDVQNGSGIKNISDLVRKEIFGKYYDEEQSIKDLTTEQIREFKRSEAELDKKMFMQAILLSMQEVI